jgi:hypothetical protein
VTEYARDIWHIGAFERSTRKLKPAVRKGAGAITKPNDEPAPAAETPAETEERQVAD